MEIRSAFISRKQRPQPDPPPINVGSLKAAGSRTESGVGFALKVDRVAKSEIQEAVDQALRPFGIDVYLVNFLSHHARPPKPNIIKEGNLHISFANITYNDNLNEFEASYLEESDGDYREREFKVCPAGDPAPEHHSRTANCTPSS